MTRVICVTNQKGGVGKTILASNLPVFLTAHGKKVLLIDVDPQANATFSLGLKPKTLPTSVYNALMGQISPMETIKNTGFMGFDIMPGSQDLAGATVELVNMKNREFKLKEIVDRVKDNYDFVIIDCPPSLGLLTLNALVASDEVLIPVQCEYLALEGLDQLVGTVNLINQNLNRKIKILGAVLTMYNRQNKLSQMVAKDVRRNFPGYVFDAVIPRTVVLSEVPFYGRTVLRYAPESKASQSFRELAEELIHNYQES